VVGLDLSLTATGVARTGAVRNGTFTVKSKGKKTDTLIERADRLADIVDDISLLIPHGAVIVIETPAYNQTGGSHHDRSGLWWLVVDKLIDMNHDHQFHEVSTTQVKKYATGKGNASKMEVMAAAIKRYPEFDIANDNERWDSTMSSTVLIDVTTKTECRVRVLHANHGEYDHLGPGVMLTLDMGIGDGRHAEVYLDPDAIAALIMGLEMA
jgi:Holliday junction resolvasome RuvABC endonuclease subunit